MKATIKLKYFKASGKFYTESEYETSALVKDDMVSMYIVSDEIKRMRQLRQLPGVSDGSDFYIVADCDKGYPVLIHPENKT